MLTIGFESAVSYLGQLQMVMAALNHADIAKMRVIGEQDIEQHFKDQKFKKLADATVKRRKANARARKRNPKVGLPHEPILMTYKKALMYATTSFANAKGFIMNNSAPHFGPHNFGFGDIPQREFFYFSEKAISAMIAVPFARLNMVASRVK